MSFLHDEQRKAEAFGELIKLLCDIRRYMLNQPDETASNFAQRLERYTRNPV